MEKKRVVVLGCGFAGVFFAQKLISLTKEYNVTLVDKNNYFAFTPMIVETVSGNIDQSNIVHPIRQIFGKKIDFFKGNVMDVDLKKKKVNTTEGSIDFDILVIALGSMVQYYGTKGAQENTFPLRSVEDAIKMRKEIIEVFERASRTKEKSKIKEMLSFAVIGGGPTGVELVAEIHDLIFEELGKQYKVPLDMAKIYIIDGNKAVLGTLNQKFSEFATKLLMKKGIEMKLNTRVKEVRRDGILFDNGDFLKVHNKYWAAGMKAVPLKLTPDVEKDRMDRIKTNEYFRLPNYQNIYAIGDIACVIDQKTGQPLPQAAQVAEKEGAALAKNLKRLTKDKTEERFVYNPLGFMLSVGKFNGVSEIKGVRFTGILAWFAWRGAYLLKLRSMRKKMKVAFDWAVNLVSQRDTSQIN